MRFQKTLLLLAAIYGCAQDAGLDRQKTVERIVASARSFDSHLPNFVCKQVTRRFQGNEGRWKQLDMYEDELTYFDRKERYRLISINGKPTKLEHENLHGGFRSEGVFGSMFSRVFRAESKTEFEWARTEVLDGKPANVLRFRVLKENSQWKSTSNGKVYVRGFEGWIWAGAANDSVLRLQATPINEADDPEWLLSTQIDLRYGVVNVGGANQLLPIRAASRISSGKKGKRNVSEFSEFRQYKSEATINFAEVK